MDTRSELMEKQPVKCVAYMCSVCHNLLSLDSSGYVCDTYGCPNKGKYINKEEE